MPRMFDILRNKGEDNHKENQKGSTPKDSSNKGNKENKEKKTPEPPLNFPREIFTSDTREKKEPEDYSLVSERLISAVKKHGIDDEEKAREMYKNTVEKIKALLYKVKIQEDLGPYVDTIHGLLDEIFNQLVLGDSILDNIYEGQKDEYYLPYHIAHVLILSSVVGLQMGFNKSRLSHLGLAAIFCDVEMEAFREITSQPRQLTKTEHDLVKTHVAKSLKTVGKIGKIDEVVQNTIQMHHERANGQGYPYGLESENINPYAKIISLVDTYEAITHDRPYRKRMNAHKAVRFLISSLKDYFDPDVMKVFINKMSIYPIGSIVRLDTHELARVVSVRSGFPLRPVVLIVQDTFGKPVQERRVIDLSQQDSVAIQYPA